MCTFHINERYNLEENKPRCITGFIKRECDKSIILGKYATDFIYEVINDLKYLYIDILIYLFIAV